ncbi:MAG: MFS transporter [Actinobacteria bacterium]|nr:MFS transporter [Actinomycetota bacterium]
MSTGPTARLPAAYWRLWTASAISNVGDGMLIAALPLLAARITDSRVSVGLISTFFSIPWLLFALPVGALIDRTDRKRVLVTADMCRGALIGGLAAVAAFTEVQVWMLWVLAFGLGVGEVFFDSTSQTILPAIVTSEQLPRANGLRYAVEISGNTFVGAPIGSILFAVAVWLPFGIDAVSFVVAALLAASLRGNFRPTSVGLDIGWRRQIRTGVRWLFRHRLLRNLALALGLTNFAFAACESTFVLFATEELGISSRGFGLLIAIVGAGSIMAGVAGGWLVNRMGRRFAILVASFSPVVTMAAIGTLPVAWWVVLMTTVQAAMITVWSIIAVTLRQQMVPDHLFGRVNSVFRWISWGAMPVGAFIGGVVAQNLGLRAPYFAGAAVMLVAYLIIVINLRERDIAAAVAANAPRPMNPTAFDDTPDGIPRDPMDDLLDDLL